MAYKWGLLLTNWDDPPSRDPITLPEDDWGVQSPGKRIVFRFHETILSFGDWIPRDSYPWTPNNPWKNEGFKPPI